MPVPTVSLQKDAIHDHPAVTTTPFIWRQIGHVRDVKVIDEREIEEIHWAVAEDFAAGSDPVSPAGVRDAKLLASAASRATTSLGNERKYVTVELATAALTHSLVHNHAFFNGNKRTALVSMLSMLDRNGLVVTSTQDELFKWMIRVAQHRISDPRISGDRSDIEVSAMATWLQNNSRLLDRGEKVLTWKFLRRRLGAFGCTVTSTGSGGGRLQINRVHEYMDRGRLGLTRRQNKPLQVQMAYAGEGREVSKTDMKHLRRELWLDDEHGIDSAMFYGTDSTPPDQFIAEYRKTLARLAKL